MRELFSEVDGWRAAGEGVALATVVRVTGSAPRREGAKLAVSTSGRMAGSVSGGCLEADVYLHAQEVLATGRSKLVTYGLSDDLAWEVGLACGGTVDILIEKLEW